MSTPTALSAPETPLEVVVRGIAEQSVRAHLDRLVADGVASGIAKHDDTLWGEDAQAEAAKRLGWTDAVAVSRPLVAKIEAKRRELAERGVDHVVLAGMGGSSLAPEVITATAGVPLTVLDSTEPTQVLASLRERLERTVLVVSSKSGSTLETDSQKRVYEQAFSDAGIDPRERIVVVTDPGSPLDESARKAGYTVFNADPNVGGRFSALTAFGLVPSGLAGVDLGALLDDAEAVMPRLAADDAANPGLVLGAVLGGSQPLRDKIVLQDEASSIDGFGDWVEQLIAESTGKNGTGLLPVLVEPDAPELASTADDVQVVRIVDDAKRVDAGPNDAIVAGSLGQQLLTWEVAISVAGRLIGINPFDQPDVESAKAAARGLLEQQAHDEPAFVDHGIEVRGTDEVVAGASTVEQALKNLLECLGNSGYVSVQAYLNRHDHHELSTLREELAQRAHRPVTFGWGPRFLHSTGQYHKGGAPTGVFLQLTASPSEDLEIPGQRFSFGDVIRAQAAGDAQVLADEKHRPVLRLNLTTPDAVATLRRAIEG